MKICIVSNVYYPDIIGGGEYSTKLLAEGLAKLGHEIDVVCLGNENKEERINEVNIRRIYIKGISEEFLRRAGKNIDYKLSFWKKLKEKPKDFFFDFSLYNKWKEMICYKNYDLIHTATPLSYMGRYNCWKVANDELVPVVHVTRSPDLYQIEFGGYLINKIYNHIIAKESRLLTGLVAPSKYMMEIHKQHHILAENEAVIYNAIDFDEIVKPNIEFIDCKEKYVLYAGHLREEKGVYTLQAACKNLEYKLVLVGRGEAEEKLKMEKNVLILGWKNKDELYELMRKAMVVVLPSEWEEAFGRILIEAIGNGTIAIGSNRGGIPEVLNEDRRYIFESGNVEDLVKHICRVLNLSDIEYLSEIKSQQLWLKKFSIATYVYQWSSFFDLCRR